MSKDESTQATIAKSQIEAAIQAVMARGWEVNPQSVAEEARVSPADIAANMEFMQLIANARQIGGEHDLARRLAQLEAENMRLKASLDEVKSVSDDDVLNEQVKALLSSESDEQLKHVEQELERAYAQVVSLEEEKTDLARSLSGLERVNEAVSVRMRELEVENTTLKSKPNEETADLARSLAGLERVNEALNLRLRELEAANVELKNKPDEDKTDLARSIAGLERVNEALNARMRELNDENIILKKQMQAMPVQDNSLQDAKLDELTTTNRINVEHIAQLENVNQQQEAMILELEGKLAELQQEADMLALQLQNAFNVGYQKGHSEAAAGAPLDETGDHHFVPEEQHEYEHGMEATAETAQQAHDAAVFNQTESFEAEHAQNWNPDSDRILNFARTGPYVASTFNPLETLSWRDLETVYSMGVLSIKDFSRNLSDYQAGNIEAESEEGNSHDQYAAEEQAHEEEPAESPAEEQPYNEQQAGMAHGGLPPSEGLDFIDELIDIDKLDIFESLEELEELGTIDVLSDLESMNFADLEDSNEPAHVEEQQASNEELQSLINSRINQALQGDSGEQPVRTPTPPPEAEVDDDDPTKIKQPFSPNLKKFVGQKAQSSEPPPPAATSSSTATPSVLAKHIPPEIRKACMILGVRQEDLSKELVLKEWKKQITTVHPDLGGDKESAVYLNTAKDTLLRWLEQNTSKLGEKFGSQGGSSRFGKNKPSDKS